MMYHVVYSCLSKCYAEVDKGKKRLTWVPEFGKMEVSFK